MVHHKKKRKLGRELNGRIALMKSLAYSLVMKEKIKTTDAKARELRPMIEKLVTLGRKNNVASRRLLVSRIGGEAAGKMMKEISPKFEGRAGGYTRITKLPRRLSDGSLMSVIEFV